MNGSAAAVGSATAAVASADGVPDAGPDVAPCEAAGWLIAAPATGLRLKTVQLGPQRNASSTVPLPRSIVTIELPSISSERCWMLSVLGFAVTPLWMRKLGIRESRFWTTAAATAGFRAMYWRTGSCALRTAFRLRAVNHSLPDGSTLVSGLPAAKA